jgi:hypothetical protein
VLAARRGTAQAALDRRQTAVATADVGCDRRTGLRAQGRQELAASLRSQPARNVALLQGTYVTRQEAVRRALQVLR